MVVLTRMVVMIPNLHLDIGGIAKLDNVETSIG